MKRRRKKRRATLDKFMDSKGGSCERCGNKDYRVLILYHPLHGACVRERILRGMTSELESIVEESELLCSNCLLVRRAED